MATVIRMPSVLAGATEAAIAHWLVAPGDAVDVGTPIAEIETEKALVEYAAEAAGVVGRLVLGEGGTGEIGDPIAVLLAAGETGADIDAALGVPPASAGDAGSAGSAPATASASRAPEGSTATPGTPGNSTAAPDAPEGSTTIPGTRGSSTAASSSPGNSTTPGTSGNALGAPGPATAAAPPPGTPAGSGTAGADSPGSNGQRARSGGRIFASPLVRKLAGERGVGLGELTGTGPGGRVTRRDLERFLSGRAATGTAPAAGNAPVPGGPAAAPDAATTAAAGGTAPGTGNASGPAGPKAAPDPALTAAAAAPAAAAPPSAAGRAPGSASGWDRGEATGADAAQQPVPQSGHADAGATDAGAAGSADRSLIPHTPMRRAIARRLAESKASVPHFYLVAEPAVDELLALRARVNAALPGGERGPARVSVNDFVVAAVAAAFGDVPEANVTWSDAGLVAYRSVDIAIAVATDGGLVTPVLRGVEGMRLSAIARESAALARRARERRLRQHELEGGTFTVSNLGMYGTVEFAAIINPPQSGILAVGAARPQPVVADGAVVPATVMRCTLSVDHRAIDGALAARWLAAFTARLENPLAAVV